MVADRFSGVFGDRRSSSPPREPAARFTTPAPEPGTEWRCRVWPPGKRPRDLGRPDWKLDVSLLGRNGRERLLFCLPVGLVAGQLRRTDGPWPPKNLPREQFSGEALAALNLWVQAWDGHLDEIAGG